MPFLGNRLQAISTYLYELQRYGIPRETEVRSHEVVFVLDGVGGFQYAPLMIRRAFRLSGIDTPVFLHRWQHGVPGEIWTDLMLYRRNRLMGARFARRLQVFAQRNPNTTIHVIGFSGGSGVAVFACERLRRPIIETLVLFCPALSPTYNLAPALRRVQQCYATVSSRDTFILGWGTKTFGTMDRHRVAAAGQQGFAIPTHAGEADRELYQRMHQIHWTDSLRPLGHYGGHTGWVSVPFLREHLAPLLRGTPQLPTAPAPADLPTDSGSAFVTDP